MKHTRRLLLCESAPKSLFQILSSKNIESDKVKNAIQMTNQVGSESKDHDLSAFYVAISKTAHRWCSVKAGPAGAHRSTNQRWKQQKINQWIENKAAFFSLRYGIAEVVKIYFLQFGKLSVFISVYFLA